MNKSSNMYRNSLILRDIARKMLLYVEIFELLRSEIPWNIIAESCGKKTSRDIFQLVSATRHTACAGLWHNVWNQFPWIPRHWYGAPRPQAPDVALWPAIRKAITDVRYAYDCLWSRSRSRSIYIYMRGASYARCFAAAAKDSLTLSSCGRSTAEKDHKRVKNTIKASANWQLEIYFSFSLSLSIGNIYLFHNDRIYCILILSCKYNFIAY